ncbi:MAG: DUF362 domain-containing protein [bacterium]|nr:DUF362 domain-containing protein [bacterium]
MNLPHVGVFHVRSDDRVVQASVVRKMLSLVREEDGLSFSGRRVLLNSGRRWQSHSFYRSLLAEIAFALGKRGATVLKLETPRSGERSLDVAEIPGDDLGGSGRPPWEELRPAQGKRIGIDPEGRPFRLPRLGADVDLVVNIACLSADPRAHLAGAMYNTIEMLRGGETSLLGSESFSEIIVDIVSKTLPDLNVLILPEIRSGAARHTFDRAQILVSTDVVAIDSIAAVLAGHEPQEVPAIRKATESGLGIGWPEAIRLSAQRPSALEAVMPGHTVVRSLEDGEAVDSWRPGGTARRTNPADTCCAVEDTVLWSASVAVCVGEARCDACRQCAGDRSLLPN